MEYTFSADVAPFVGAMGEAIAAAKRFEAAVHDARDAELELGASGGDAAAGLAAQAAAMDAAAHSADKLNRQHNLLHTAMTDAERAARDAGRGIGDLEKVASEAAGSGGGLSKMGGMLSSLGMPAAIAGLAGLAAGATPAILSLGAGFGAFAAMAYPALSKVKSGLTAVTQAQKTYDQAKVLATRDPTKTNLAAEARDLQKLKATWAGMPAPVRGAVSEIQQFGKAWHEASVKSGLQKAAFGDIRLAVRDAKELIPVATQLGKAFQPIVHSMLGGLGKEFRSKGFLNFISGLKKDMAPAANALKGIGSAMGGFITQLTGREAKPGTQMLQSIGKFLHTITPGTVSGLVGLTKGMTGLINSANQLASSKFVSDMVTAGKAVNHFLHSSTIKGSMGWQVLQAEQKVMAEQARTGFSRQVGNLQKSSNLQAMIHARIRVKADGGDIRKQIEAATSGKGGNIPVKGKVTLTGLKTGIQQQIAGLHIPDSK